MLFAKAHAELLLPALDAPPHHQPVPRLKDMQRTLDPRQGQRAAKDRNTYFGIGSTATATATFTASTSTTTTTTCFHRRAFLACCGGFVAMTQLSPLAVLVAETAVEEVG
jgi:hypothetical protein